MNASNTARKQMNDSQQDAVTMVDNAPVEINQNKDDVRALTHPKIVELWVQVANAMQVLIPQGSQGMHRENNDSKDVGAALSNLNYVDKCAALFFATNCAKDSLFSSCVLGMSHQNAVEDCVVHVMNVKLETKRADVTGGQKTRTAKMHGSFFNQKKQKLMQRVLGCNEKIAVCRDASQKADKRRCARRDKHVHCVHRNDGFLKEMPSTIAASAF